MTNAGVIVALLVLAAVYQLAYKTGWGRGYDAAKAGKPDPRKDRPYVGGSEV